MTLQRLPPPNVDCFEFDQDIESGLRPPLFTRDVSSRAILNYVFAVILGEIALLHER